MIKPDQESRPFVERQGRRVTEAQRFTWRRFREGHTGNRAWRIEIFANGRKYGWHYEATEFESRQQAAWELRRALRQMRTMVAADPANNLTP